MNMTGRNARHMNAVMLSLALLLGGALAHAGNHAATQTAATQAALTPDKALEMLKTGNERFVKGKPAKRDLRKQVAATAGGQYPHSVVLGCIDSRVPPEMVFDQGIGDIFSPRIAGNFITTDLLGSMEFAAGVAGSKLIVVLGHSECGAVKGACDGVEVGNLTSTLANIAPAIYAVKDVEGERSSKNPAFVDAVAHENVNQTVANILERSTMLAGLVEKGDLKVVGAMYSVATGEVTFME